MKNRYGSGMPACKCVVFGECGSGKTSLTLRYVSGQFRRNYATAQDSFRKQITMKDGTPMRLDIMDINACSHECFWQSTRSMYDQWLREASVFFLCFAVNSKMTFDALDVFRERLVRAKHEHRCWAMLLVGTKCDLCEARQVSRDAVVALAKQWGVAYIETSAKVGANVDFLFDNALLHLWASRATNRRLKLQCQKYRSYRSGVF